MNLSNLLKGGFPLLRSLDLLIDQTDNRRLSEIIGDLRQTIQNGGSLSEGMNRYPEVFFMIYAGMVKAGEGSGSLEETLSRLTGSLEREEDLKSFVAASLTYPLIMLILGISTIGFLMTFVIPKFTLIFEDLGGVLPLPTRLLVLTSFFLAKFWWAILGGGVFALLFLREYRKTEEGKLAFDRTRLKLPFLGETIRHLAITRFTATLGILATNGVPILSALDMVKEVAGNEVLRRVSIDIHRGVSEGKSLALCLETTDFFPQAVVDMVRVGEESGNLEDALLKIADIYEKGVNKRIKTFLSLLEPMLILIMAIVVAFIVLAMLLPIFTMGDGGKL